MMLISVDRVPQLRYYSNVKEIKREGDRGDEESKRANRKQN